MTLSKSALTVTSLAMAMLFGGGVYLLMNMNVIAKNYIEREATKTLGVSVKLGGLEIMLQDRTAKVTDLVIGNPEGFEKPYAVKVSNISVVLSNVTNQLVEFKDIDVGNAEVNLEVKENVTNLAAIKNRVKVTENDSATAEAVKVIIDKLTLSQAQIKPGKVLFTEEELAPVQVPDIVLTAVGRRENGILVREAIAQVWTHIAHKLDTQALQSGLLEGMSDEALQDMGLGFGQRFKENLHQTIQEKKDAVGQGIDSFFND
jgi:uncharacterized protein involved in outer membrane biogenesis